MATQSIISFRKLGVFATVLGLVVLTMATIASSAPNTTIEVTLSATATCAPSGSNTIYLSAGDTVNVCYKLDNTSLQEVDSHELESSTQGTLSHSVPPMADGDTYDHLFPYTMPSSNLVEEGIWRSFDQGITQYVSSDAAFIYLCQPIFYVDQTAIGTNTGLSWTNAFTDLQDALAAARTCPPSEIRVAKGNYKPHASDRSVSFELVEGVTIIGGYDTGGSPTPSTNDLTVLTGDLGTADSGTVSTGNATRQDNSYRVVTATGLSSTTLKNLTVSDGNANGADPENVGGGITSSASGLTISEVIVENNSASIVGGVLGSANSPLTITVEDSIIRANHSNNWAGGMQLAGTGSHVVVRSEFSGNNANGPGGALTLRDGASIIYNSKFFDNTAADGGALEIKHGASPDFYNSLFFGNSASSAGGVAHVWNGAQPDFRGVTITGNSAATAGAFNNISTANVLIKSTILWDNPSAGSSLVGPVDTDNLVVNNPMFVDAGANDYRLMTSSPAINAGNNVQMVTDSIDVDGDLNTTEMLPDLDLNDRIQDTTMDAGAYELGICGTSNTTVYVDIDATGANNGSSWANSYTDLQDGLNFARVCGATEIRIAKGEYHPHPSDRTVSFVMVDGVKVVGGYAPGGSATPTTNDLTILTGDLNDNDNGNIDNLEPTRADNSRNVVQVVGVMTGGSLENLTIEGGNNVDADGAYQSGGGIYFLNSGPYKLDGVIVARNAVDLNGGGIHVGAANLIVKNSRITNNYANVNGGGVHKLGGATGWAFIFNSEIDNNVAQQGAGLMVVGNTALTNTLVHNNTASVGGGGLMLFGSPPVGFYHSVIADNTATSGWGGIDGSPQSSSRLDSTVVWNNTGGAGTDVEDLAGFSAHNNHISGASPLFGPGTYIPTASSPLIDFGYTNLFTDFGDLDDDSNTSELMPIDLAGNVRWQGTRPDIGAYETAGGCLPVMFVNAASTSGIETGGAWSTAYTNLHDALAVANTCGGAEIRIAEGSYYAGATGFAVPNDTKLVGGFGPASGPGSIAAWPIYETILTGDLNGDDIFDYGTTTTTYSDNSTTIIDGAGSTNTELEQLTIRGAEGAEAATVSESVVRVTFTENRATLAILRGDTTSALKVVDSRFVRNRVSFPSGGIIFVYEDLSVTNTEIKGHKATGSSGIRSNTVNTDLDVTNSLIAHTGHHGIFWVGDVLATNITTSDNVYGIRSNGGNVTITNSILRNAALDAVLAPGGITATYSNIESSCCAGTGNINADAEFVSPWTGDPDTTDYRLSLASPSLNAGNNADVPSDSLDIDQDSDTAEPTPDLARKDRIVDGRVEMGPHEFVPQLFTQLATPCPVFDSTQAAAAPWMGTLDGDDVVQVRVTNGAPFNNQGGNVTGCGVTSDVTAVMFNITALNPVTVGNLRLSEADVVPDGGVVTYNANTLNNSNTVTVPISADGKVDVSAFGGVAGAGNPATDVRLTVVGYYSPTGTLKYVPLTPCATADSRTDQGALSPFAGPFAAGTTYEVQVADVFDSDQGGGNTDCLVPKTAAAVLVNVVATTPTGNGGVAVGTGGTTPTETTTSYANIGINNSAVAVVTPDTNDYTMAISIIGTGSTEVRVVVLGYFTTTGVEYEAVNPCAVFDSRTGIFGDTNPAAGSFAGPRTAGTSGANLTGVTTYNVTGAVPADQGGELDCNIPESATAVLINLVALSPTSVGNFRAYATGTSPTGGVLNFNALSPALNNSNAVVVPISALGNLDLFVNSPSNNGNPTAEARGVVLGYFK